MNKALIFGVTGQDGSYLADFLLSKGYRVKGVSRRASVDTKCRIALLMNNPMFEYGECDITDYISVENTIKSYMPLEIYSLAAQSHVHTSFSQPVFTWNVDAMGVLNILEVTHSICSQARVYQASSSEMFGKNVGPNGYQNEDTAFKPQSPYAIAKVAAHHAVSLYRDMYKLHASCGILFNHEGARRGEMFVTRKITKYVAHLKVFGRNGPLFLGNLNAHRDWGHAIDYVRAMYLMLQQEHPDDYVVATGETHTVREFCQEAFSLIGENYTNYVRIDANLFRPAEVDYLRGDFSKATRVLGWEPEYSFKDLVTDMVESDIKVCEREQQCMR